MKMLLLVQMCLGLLLAPSILANNENVKETSDLKFKVGQKLIYDNQSLYGARAGHSGVVLRRCSARREVVV